MIKIEGMINLEEGEYIRTKNGSIFKIIGGTPDNYDIDIDYYNLGKIEDDIFEDLTTFNYNDNGNFIRDITKTHSFNIKDLIEEGDYVNGQEIITIYGYDEDGNDRDELGIVETDCDFAYEVYLTDLNIKSIVTKEQFKRMEYKVDE